MLSNVVVVAELIYEAVYACLIPLEIGIRITVGI